MHAPRTIGATCEIFHPPREVDPRGLQRVHNQLFESGVVDYQGFAVTPIGVVLSNPGSLAGHVSSAAFLLDRVQYREEQSSLTVEDFAARVRRTGELASRHASLPPPTGMLVTLRALVNPRAFRDSREFLGQAVLRFGAELGEFGRAPELYGLRLVFPHSEDEPGAHAIRIESYQQDPRSLFLENQASFPALDADQDWSQVESNILAAYAFLVERSIAFVACYDARQETP